MNYDFDQPVQRRGTDSAKWSYFDPDVLPLWVADMDFHSPQPIIDALQARVAQGVFGYGMESKMLREVLVERMQRLYGWTIVPEDIVYLPGLVSGLNVISRAIGEPGDGALVNTPVYGPFLSAPVNQQREVQVAPLAVTREGQRMHYTVDLAVTEAAVRPNTKLFILCNPHNPVGRAWTRNELQDMAAICEHHDLIICSDEIHCDLMLDGAHHVPMASIAPEVAERTITLMAPSKTFNVPGLGASFAIIQNKQLRKTVESTASGIVPHVNILGMTAAEAAYTHCNEWLLALRAYLTANRDFAVRFIEEHLPQVKTTVPEATYLLWLDLNNAGLGNTPADILHKQARLAVNEAPGLARVAKASVRLNFGTSRETL
ncbi:MAG: putative C-S lyase, partial [Anaerolineales bacterium]|nr:putative C-S lyase [Anaerolineales bacterium]